MRFFTVWAELDEKRAPSFEIFPKVSEPPARDQVVYLTNRPELLEGLFSPDKGRVCDIWTLYPFAFPLEPVEDLKHAFARPGIPEGPPAIALHALWKQMEAALQTLPVWVLNQVALILREVGENAAANVFHSIVQDKRDQAEKETAWRDSFPPTAAVFLSRPNAPAPTDPEPIDPDDTLRHLLPGGSFASFPGYETRQGQIDMTTAVIDAMNEERHLVVEAGTGIGKSLAYLIPAAAWADKNHAPVIISTKTHNLQSQLIYKDVPRVVEAFHSAAPEKPALRVALLKGRSNYFCLRRLSQLLDASYLADLERPELRHFAESLAWAVRTPDGDLENFGNASRCDRSLLDKLSSGNEECPGKRCPFRKRCFAQKARTRAANAQLVIVNHSLVFADAISGGGVILPPYRRLIFDEAHQLEECATDHFSREISPVRLYQTLSVLNRKKGNFRSGVLEMVRRDVQQGSFTKDIPIQKAILEEIKDTQKQCDRVGKAFQPLFGILQTLIPNGRDAIRYRCDPSTDFPNGNPIPVESEPPLTRTVSEKRSFVNPPRTWDEEEAARRKTDAKRAITDLLTHLRELSNLLTKAETDETLLTYRYLPESVDRAAALLSELDGDLDFVWKGANPDYVFWAEKLYGASGGAKISAAPLSVAKEMKTYFYDTIPSIIFCSATLRVDQTFNHYAARIGLNRIPPNRVKTLAAASPFDYPRQCQVFAPTFLPDPAQNLRVANEQLEGFLLDLIKKLRGRTLILFTSIDSMSNIARSLRSPLEAAGISLLVQNDNGTRDQITQRFRDTTRSSVLFGVSSFWEGMDIPGDALRCVVITRLPFTPPDEPVFAARCEQIEQNGGHSFFDLSIPTAIIKFRQGFGRLIRSRADSGIVIITDPRIYLKNYGRKFLTSIPCPTHQVATPQEFFDQITPLFPPQPIPLPQGTSE